MIAFVSYSMFLLRTLLVSYNVQLQSLMIAAIPNVAGWLAISFAKVSDHYVQIIHEIQSTIATPLCTRLLLQDSSILYMGRLLGGFGVGVISYVVNFGKLFLVRPLHLHLAAV